MTTFATTAADRSGTLIVGVTIEAIGSRGSSTPYMFCTRKPTWSGGYFWQDYLVGYPSTIEESLSPLGGLPDSGELSFELLDFEDFISSLIRTDAVAQTTLSTAMTTGTTSMVLSSNLGIFAGLTYFIGAECVYVSSFVSGTTWTVTRAIQGTEAATHAIGDAVFAYSPFILGRRVRMYMAFEESDSSLQEIGGGWYIDSVALGEGLNSWVFQAKSQLKYLDRLTNRRQWQTYITAQGGTTGRPQIHFGLGNLPALHFSDRIFLEVDDKEIVMAYPSHLGIAQRGVGGSTIEDDWPDRAVVTQVYLADSSTGYGSFRYQAPGGETGLRTSGTWISYDHPVVILLSILTSHSAFDATNPTNYGSDGNYSALPPGVGLGIPAALINFDSFLNVWYRTQNFRLPYFKLDGIKPAREIFDALLKVTGFDLKIRNGLLYLDYPRLPTPGDATTTWTTDNILTEDDGDGNRRPKISAHLDTEHVATSVVFKTRTPQGRTVDSVFTDQTFSAIFGNIKGLYSTEDKRIEIDASMVRSDQLGGEPELIKQRALQLLSRFRRPLWVVELSTDLSQYATEAGDLVLLTYSDLPNLSTGDRGWDEVVCKVLSKRYNITESQVSIDWTVVAYGTTVNAGRVAPSACISGTPVGNVATCIANRYTDPNNLLTATTDVEAFAVGDVLELKNRLGVPLNVGYVTVTAIGTNTLTLSDNFGGSGEFAAGRVLEFSRRENAVCAQYDNFVYLATEATQVIGSSSDTVWVFGEP